MDQQLNGIDGTRGGNTSNQDRGNRYLTIQLNATATNTIKIPEQNVLEKKLIKRVFFHADAGSKAPDGADLLSFAGLYLTLVTTSGVKLLDNVPATLFSPVVNNNVSIPTLDRLDIDFGKSYITVGNAVVGNNGKAVLLTVQY